MCLRLQWIVLPLLCLCIGTASGCSKKGGGPEDSSEGEPIPFELMCDAFVADACKAIFECDDLDPYFDYKDTRDCEEDLPCRGFADLESSKENGWVAYDAEKMGECHARLQADPCGEAESLGGLSLQGVLLICDDAVVGLQEEGDPCTDLLDCKEGLYCAVTDECPGECTPWLEEGDSCDVDDSSQTCNPFDNLDCMDGVCKTYAAEGEPCDNSTECEWDFVCSDQIDGDEDPVCIPLGEKGSACRGSNHCAFDLVCVTEDADDETGECSPTLEKGAYCEFDAACGDGLACLEDVCTDAPIEGEACTDYFFGGDNCAAGFVCDDGVCKSFRYIGDSCDDSLAFCAESRCEDGTCVPRLQDGEPCESSYECHSRSCTDNICVDPALCSNSMD